MKKIGLTVISVIVLGFLLVMLAGIYKFNYLANQPGYDVDGNTALSNERITKQKENRVIYASQTGDSIEVIYQQTDTVEVHFMRYDDVYLKAFTAIKNPSASGAQYITKDKRFMFCSKGNEASIFDQNNKRIFSGKAVKKVAKESIYFDPVDKAWKDQLGTCNSCHPDNGFTNDGQIINAPVKVIWQELFVTLKNDLAENPPLAEVTELFASHYNADPEWFGTHVSLQDNVYRIVIATEHKNVDFMDARGVLKATYEVIQVKKE